MSIYYQDEWVTLHLGDCLEVTDWLAADVLVTDPPYGIHHTKHGSSNVAVAGEVRSGRAANRTIPREFMKERDHALFLWGRKPKRPAMVFGSWRAPRPYGTMMRLVWDKVTPGMGGVGGWRASDEEIYLIDWPNPKGSTGTPSRGSVIRRPTLRGASRKDHPTPKPIDLMVELISQCPPGTIADPFAGSGSTLVAAKALGRKAIGVELEERYCEIAAKRLAQDVLDFGGAA